MYYQNYKGRKSIKIAPGEYFVTKNRMVLSTLLGSCVAVCLYDEENGVAGMNHFLLSNNRYSKTMPFAISEAGRYGIHSMELLINSMMRHGAKRSRLQAKAFGGTSVLGLASQAGNFNCVGEVNCRFIREFLGNEGIPLVTSDLGGCEGRVIYFDADDFSVYVRKIQKGKIGRLAEQDMNFWHKSLVEQEQLSEGNCELWLPNGDHSL
jgi:chemotaxis protein CheD